MSSFLLGQFATDKAHDALAERGNNFAFPLTGVVDEFVDDEIGPWPYGECRSVHEQRLHQTLAGGVDALIVKHRVADLDFFAFRESLRLYRSSDADLFGSDWICGED